MKLSAIIILSIATCSVSKAQNIGIGTSTPSDKLHISSTAPGVNAFRVQVNGSTKLRVNESGGTSIGTLTAAPANGLLVQGPIDPQAGIKTNNKLIVESTGDSMILNAGGSQIILAANGNITIKAPSGKIVIDAPAGDLELKGLNVKIQAGNTVSINGSSVRLNNGTRPASGVNDPTLGTVSGNTAQTTIMAGANSTVMIT